MPKQKTSRAVLDEMKGMFLTRVDELWEKHIDEAIKILEESEAKQVNLSFRVHLDFSESKAIQEITVGYAQVHKDKVSDSFDDPDAPAIPDADDPDAPALPGMAGVKRGRGLKTVPETAALETAALKDGEAWKDGPPPAEEKPPTPKKRSHHKKKI